MATGNESKTYRKDQEKSTIHIPWVWVSEFNQPLREIRVRELFLCQIHMDFSLLLLPKQHSVITVASYYIILGILSNPEVL